MKYEHIKYEVAEGVAIITLNRPEKLNAFDNKMLKEWHDAISSADKDDEVRVIVLTGEGRGFCAGMDVGDEAGGVGVLRSQDS